MLYSSQWTKSCENIRKGRGALCTSDSLPHGAYENNIDCVYTASGIAKTVIFMNAGDAMLDFQVFAVKRSKSPYASAKKV